MQRVRQAIGEIRQGRAEGGGAPVGEAQRQQGFAAAKLADLQVDQQV